MSASRGRLGFGLACLMLAVGLLGAAGLVALGTIGSAEEATPAGDISIADFSLPYTPEGQAQFGNIFIGSVLREAGKDEIPSSLPERSLPVLLYDVTVDRTLKGDVSGEVRIWYQGFNATDPDDPSRPTLKPGDRALFFAGYNPETDEYPVDARIGTILINSDGEARELVALYEPLIRDAERNGRGERKPDPYETPDSEPTISVEPVRGSIGDQVSVTGGPFARAEVAVSWDGPQGGMVGVPVGEDCGADGFVVVPELPAGEHTIIVRDALDREAKVPFEVTVGGR